MYALSHRIQIYEDVMDPFSTVLFVVGSAISDIRKLRVNPDDFATVKLIGQGHFGQVKVVKEKITGEIYALKVIRKKDILSHQEVSIFRDFLAFRFTTHCFWW